MANIKTWFELFIFIFVNRGNDKIIIWGENSLCGDARGWIYEEGDNISYISGGVFKPIVWCQRIKKDVGGDKSEVFTGYRDNLCTS